MYAGNENLKNASLQVAAAIQKAIDYPNKALDLEPEVIAANSCYFAVSTMQDPALNKLTQEMEAIEDIVTGGDWE